MLQIGNVSLFQVDKRYPNVIRVTPVHLYNSYRDVHRFMRVLLDSLDIIEKELEKESSDVS